MGGGCRFPIFLTGTPTKGRSFFIQRVFDVGLAPIGRNSSIL